ncbi:MAG: translation elongation factor Ts [Bacilli bacterium]|nr:translation elongation factor Ts [Bacilli bacterium]
MINADDVKRLRDRTGAGILDCKKALEATDNDLDKALDWLREKGITKAMSKADRIAAEGLGAVIINDNEAVILEVNSETDFVAKNDEFKNLVLEIGNTILKNKVTTLDEALKLETTKGTIHDLIVAATAKIGEKISLRRFTLITKQDQELFGSYLHMGGKIAVLVVISGGNEEIAKNLTMQVAAMNPKYIKREDISPSDLEHEKLIIKEQAINEGKPEAIALKMVEGRINKFYQEVCLNEQSFIKNNDITVKQYIENNNCDIKQMIRYEVGEGMEKRDDNFADEVMSQLN